MTELGELGAARGDFHQGAARPCNGAFQKVYEHPWGTKSHALAKLLLPGTIGWLFGDDGGAHGHDLMDEAAMQTFAMGRQLAFPGGAKPPDGKVPLAVLPPEAVLPMLLHSPALIVVVRVVGATLS